MDSACRNRSNSPELKVWLERLETAVLLYKIMEDAIVRYDNTEDLTILKA